VPKRRYSGFTGTDLDILRGEHGVGSVVLTGLHANTCVWRTAGDAFLNGYALLIPEDGARISSADELLRQETPAGKSA
jgi:nicotinamidase-related amidase